jgi:hypothetical protein
MEVWKVKQLCDDIEKTCRSRDEINLVVSLCNQHPNLYGEKAYDKRRAVQKKFDLLKRKTIEQYAQFLDKLEVSHGAATLRELRGAAFKKDSSASTSTATATDDNDSTEVHNKTDKNNSTTTGDLETLVASLSIAEPPAAATPVKTPSPFIRFSSPAHLKRVLHA